MPQTQASIRFVRSALYTLLVVVGYLCDIRVAVHKRVLFLPIGKAMHIDRSLPDGWSVESDSHGYDVQTKRQGGEIPLIRN
jgi:hypothetical protein